MGNETGKKSFDYFAFISYSHKDMAIAKRLKKRLQSYHLPAKLRKTYPSLPKKLGPIFIDEERLTGGVLQEAIRENLDSSNYLILLCSPNSAKSVYVNEEVKHFIEIDRADHIIPFIIDGVPRSEDESLECFPPALLALPFEKELLGIDLSKFGERDAFLRVIATMLELDLDNFVSYEAGERKRRLMIFTPIVATLAVIFVGLVWYGMINKRQSEGLVQFLRGIEYYSKDYAQAKELWEKAAANGNADAQIALGVMYQRGEGVKKDYAKAAEWYEKAAVNGNADAQFSMGVMFRIGIGVKQDYAKAKELFEKAAAQGNAEAQYSIGKMYRDGLGVLQSNEKAIEWFIKATKQGHMGAIIEFAKLFQQ